MGELISVSSLSPRARPELTRLGLVAQKLLHTMAARFPEKPTASEREALKSFIYLFARLYPCGEVSSLPVRARLDSIDHG